MLSNHKEHSWEVLPVSTTGDVVLGEAGDLGDSSERLMQGALWKKHQEDSQSSRA